MLRIDCEHERLWCGDEELVLRRKPLAVLRYLSERRGRIVDRRELLTALWPGTHVSPTVLKVCIREIRTVLADDAKAPTFVETIPWKGYRWIGEAVVIESRTGDPLAVRERSPISWVGRERELAEIRARFDRARCGERQVLFVTGEGGIGKSALVSRFVATLERDEARVAQGAFVELSAPAEPYLAVIDALDELARGVDRRRVVAILERYAPTWLVEMPGLVGAGELEPLRRRVGPGGRERMLREIVDALEALAQEKPLVFALEDLQWSDDWTLDLLSRLARRRGLARLLLVGTYRPVDAIREERRVCDVRRALLAHRLCTDLQLRPFDAAEIRRYLDRRFPLHELPTELVNTIAESSDGNPELVETLVDELVARESIAPSGAVWRLRAPVEEARRTFPEALRERVEGELDGLSELERRILEIASVVGEEFSPLLAANALGESAETIEECSEKLVRRGILLRRIARHAVPEETITMRYAFRRRLVQAIFGERLSASRRTRLQHLIGGAGDRLAGPRLEPPHERAVSGVDDPSARVRPRPSTVAAALRQCRALRRSQGPEL